MRVHEQHYSFQNVYKKIKSQSNNTWTEQSKHTRVLQSPCSLTVTEMDQQRVSLRTWQQTFENKGEKKKKKKITGKMLTIKQYLQQRSKTHLH